MAQLNLTSFPILQTDRLVLRQLSKKDKKEIAALRSDAIVNKYLDRPKKTSIEDAEKFIEKINASIESSQSFYWAIEKKEHPKLIGTICLWNFSLKEERAEIGYELASTLHGSGIMSEAIKKVIEFGFNTVQLKIIEAWTILENTASIKILERHHFTRNKERENEIDEKDKPTNSVIYSLKK